MLEAIDRAQGSQPEIRTTERVEIRPPVSRLYEGEAVAEPPGPGVVSRIFFWVMRRLTAAFLWLLRRPQRMSRRLGGLAAIVAMVMLLNVPFVSNGLMELAIETLPWTQVQVVSDGLNLRAEPSRSAPIRTALDSGNTVSITGLPQEHEDITWWPVMANGESGWVAEADQGETYLEETSLMSVVTLPGEVRDTVGGLLGFLIP